VIIDVGDDKRSELHDVKQEVEDDDPGERCGIGYEQDISASYLEFEVCASP